MAIPKATDQLGQQVEKAQAAPTPVKLENEPAVFAAQAIQRSYESLAQDINRGVGSSINLLRGAQEAAEKVRAKEAASELELRNASARLEVENEEQDFIKSNNRLFTPEERRNAYASKLDNIRNDIKARYKFDWLREENDVATNDFIERQKVNYETTVIHQKTVDAVGMSLNNTLINYQNAISKLYETGATDVEIFAKVKEMQDFLDDPNWMIVKREGYGAWKEETAAKIRKNAWQYMKQEDRVALVEQYQQDAPAALATPAGQYFGTALGSTETLDMVEKDKSYIAQKENAKRVEQERVWSNNAAEIAARISDAETRALVRGEPFEYSVVYNALRADINKALENGMNGEQGGIGIKQYQSLVEKANNSFEKLEGKKERAQDRSIRREELRQKRLDREYQQYGAANDSLETGVPINADDPQARRQAERFVNDHIVNNPRLTPEQKQAALGEVTQRLGYVPNAAVANAARDLKSDDPVVVGRAVVQVEAMSQTDPSVMSRIGERQANIVAMARSTNVTEAIATVKQAESFSPEQKKELAKAAPKVLEDKYGGGGLHTNLKMMLKKNGVDYDLPPSAYADAQTIFDNTFVATGGDVDAASARAAKEMKNRYRLTNVTSDKPYPLQYTPEQELGGSVKASKWAQQEWFKVLDGMKVPLEERSMYKLGNDSQTENPVEGRPRTFPIYKRQPNGTWAKLPGARFYVDKDTFQMDMKDEAYDARQQANAESHIFNPKSPVVIGAKELLKPKGASAEQQAKQKQQEQEALAKMKRGER